MTKKERAKLDLNRMAESIGRMTSEQGREMCRCGHRRGRHEDAVGGLAKGHGGCTQMRCPCRKFTWVSFGIWACLLLMPVLSWATPVSYEFTGALLATGEPVTASWTVDLDSPPLAYNVSNLAPNATYGVDSRVTLAAFTGGFTQYCSGYCIFASPVGEVLRLRDGAYELQLMFTPGFETWEERGSWLKIYREGGDYSWLFFDQSSVGYGAANTPEPNYVWPLMGLLVVVTLLGTYRQVRR